MKFTKKLLAILLAAAMLLSILPTFAFADDPVGTSEITSADFISYDADGGVSITDYTGTQSDVTFTGIQAVQLAYQPRFYFSDAGVSHIQSYAAANGYDTLTIHAYGVFSNNCGVYNNQMWFADWNSISVNVADISASTYFWFASEVSGTMYLWFEFSASPFVTTASFANPWWSEVTPGTYEIGTYDYQPHFYFSQEGIDKMQAYAALHDVDTLRIAGQYVGDNCLVLNNQAWIGSDNPGYLDVKIADMTTAFDIWSQNTSGQTRITLTFTAYKAPLLNRASVTGGGWSFENVIDGTAGGKSFTGLKASSSAYQPDFYLTADAVADIQAKAEAAGADVIRFRVYADIYNNGFILNGNYVGNQDWTILDIPVASLSTSTRFWSQSEGVSNVWISAELIETPALPVNAFAGVSGSGFSFWLADGPIAGVDGTFVAAWSRNYQPSFTFSQAGVDAVNAYAEAHDCDTMRLWTNATLYNNGFVVNGGWTGGDGSWTYRDVAVADLTTGYTFWSQSEGTSTVYIYAEFYKMPVINAASFTGIGGFSNNLDGTVSLANADYQPHFYFTAAAVDAIKAYATANGCDKLRITATYNGTNCLVLNNQQWIGGTETKSLDVTIADLTTAFDFWSQSEIGTTVTFSFEFLEAVHVHNFVAGETVLPTCSEAGYTVYSCECGETENRNVVNALGHDIITDAAVPASCTTNGLTAGEHCSRCDYAVAQETVTALGHDYTYTDNGDDHTVGCSRCDYSVTEAHTFVEGVCVCGAVEVTENIDNNLTFATVNLQLESYIGADFFFLKTKVADYDSYYVRFTYPTADGDVTEDLPAEEYGKYFFAEHTVAAKEMSDTIQATIYAVKDGVTFHGPTTEWTLKDAMRTKFDGAKSTEADKALCVAILNYGAKAQARFSYNVDDLATSVLTAEEIATYLPAARAAQSVDATTSNGLTGVSFYKMALSAGSVTVLNIMFTKAAATDIADVECRISYTDRAGVDQVEVIDSFTASGSRFVALFNKLTAKQLGDTISITFYSKTSGEPISETKTFSEESYIALNPSANEAQTALYTALIQYADAAAAKFA